MPGEEVKENETNPTGRVSVEDLTKRKLGGVCWTAVNLVTEEEIPEGPRVSLWTGTTSQQLRALNLVRVEIIFTAAALSFTSLHRCNKFTFSPADSGDYTQPASSIFKEVKLEIPKWEKVPVSRVPLCRLLPGGPLHICKDELLFDLWGNSDGKHSNIQQLQPADTSLHLHITYKSQL